MDTIPRSAATSVRGLVRKDRSLVLPIPTQCNALHCCSSCSPHSLSCGEVQAQCPMALVVQHDAILPKHLQRLYARCHITQHEQREQKMLTKFSFLIWRLILVRSTFSHVSANMSRHTDVSALNQCMDPDSRRETSVVAEHCSVQRRSFLCFVPAVPLCEVILPSLCQTMRRPPSLSSQSFACLQRRPLKHNSSSSSSSSLSSYRSHT